MRFSQWLRPLTARLSRVSTPRARRRRTFRPGLERLEDRTVPSVTSLTDLPVSHLTAVSSSSTLYFVANDPSNGLELWRTDGVPGAGHTVQVYTGGKPLLDGNLGNTLVAAGRYVYFFTDDGGGNATLWRSDSTTDTSTALQSFSPADQWNTAPYSLTAVGQDVYFVANAAASLTPDHSDWGYEIWKTDGSTGATVPFKDTLPGPDGGYPDLAAAGSYLYYDLGEGPDQNVLYGITDLSTGAATPVQGDPPVYAVDSGPANRLGGYAAIGSNLYLLDGNGSSIWSVSGPTAVAEHITDLASGSLLGGSIGFFGHVFTLANSALYFVDQTDFLQRVSLWKYDGSTLTELNSSILPSPSQGVSQMAVIGSDVYFTGLFDFGSGGAYPPVASGIWRYNGTTGGIELVVLGSANDYPSLICTVGDILYYIVNGGVYETDGSDPGTLVPNVPREDVYFFAEAQWDNSAVIGSTVYFADGGLWRVDAPPTSVQIVSPTITSAGQVGFSAQVAGPTPGDEQVGYGYTIDWGDGTAQAPDVTTVTASANDGNGSLVLPSHTYAPGIYTIALTATDEAGLSNSTTALVVDSTTAGDSISLSGGSSAGQVAVTTTDEGSFSTASTPDQVMVAGSGGSDAYTVNFGSDLIAPIVITGSGSDSLIANGSSGDNNIIKQTGSTSTISWGPQVGSSVNPLETVGYAGMANVTINGGSGNNYIQDPGSNTTINGGSGQNTIVITGTSGNGVVIKGGPNANTYAIDMGNLLGPVTINSTTGTSTVTINGPSGSNVLTLTGAQLTGDAETINLNLGTTAANFTVAGGSGNNQLVVQGTPPGPLTAQNVAPTVGAITAPTAPTSLGTAISASASFSDLDSDSLTAVWDWGDNTTTTQTVSQYGTSGSVSASHTYTAAGVYTVTLTLTDATNSNLSGQSTFQYVVIYDASAGFVTGGGWFNSPANSTATGKANFGLNAKYHSGSTVPAGQAAFQFPAANLDFHSTSYDWLVINSNQAQFQGSGTINGSGNYGVLVSVADNDSDSGGGPDAIRIQIWDKNNNNAVVYDTQLGAAIRAAPSTLLGGGDIQVHGGSAPMIASGVKPVSGTHNPAPSQPTPQVDSSGSSSIPTPNPMPILQTPYLLELVDVLLGGIETVNTDGTESLVDSFFGLPLLVSTFDSAGNLEGVDLFGIFNVTLLFELL